MKTVTLGKTGLKISRVGFGGIPIQRSSEQDVCHLFDIMQERGINFVDTARGYSVSESYIGAALEGRRNKFIIATKSMARSRDGMAADIERSLTNLRTDYIDLYQIHGPSMANLDEVCGEGGALEALFEARAAGKIGHIGLTAHSMEVFERALELEWVETVMFPYNIVETQGEELIAKCAEKNIGFICMKPIAGGAIEDTALAMRFIAANPAVTVIIPGMYTAEEVDQNIASAEDTSPLSDDELARCKAIRDDLGSTFCRRCNYCAPCTVGINIPNSFLFKRYLERYGTVEWAKSRYNALPVKPSDCIGCGVCEPRCPYNLPIREMLKEVSKAFD